MSLSIAVKIAIWSGSAIATGTTAAVVAIKKTEAGKKAWTVAKTQAIKIWDKTKTEAEKAYDASMKAVETKKNEIKDKVDEKVTLETLRKLADAGNIGAVMSLLKKQPVTIEVK